MKAANVSSKSTCSVDWRSHLLGCQQDQIEWCWAAVTADLTNFWCGDAPPVRRNYCSMAECAFAGHKFGEGNTCCENPSSSKCNKPAWGIVDGLRWRCGNTITYTREYGKTQDELDAILNANTGPVVVGIEGPKKGDGAHVILIGGCSQSGQYYVHDPADAQGVWKEVSWPDLFSYEGGKYFQTVYRKSSANSIVV